MLNETKYYNPWSTDPTFVNLGELKIGADVYDLYALESSGDISFGARYGDKASEYLSGVAFHRNRKWRLYGSSLPVTTAMARYFANHGE